MISSLSSLGNNLTNNTKFNIDGPYILNPTFNTSNNNKNFIDTANGNTIWINLVFTQSGRVKIKDIPSGKRVYLLAVGGGGCAGAGDNGAGGGGAGGYIETRIYPNINEIITVTIGAGSSNNKVTGGNTKVVGSSSGINITAYGGGGGSGGSTTVSTASGITGASGGGQGRDKRGIQGIAITNYPAMNIGNNNFIPANTLQGKNGGAAQRTGSGGSGGGGGAGGVGGDGGGNGTGAGEFEGAGGVGRQYSLPGIRHDYYWAGGGGGGGPYGKYGGLGGGGQGIFGTTASGTAPTVGTSYNLGGTASGFNGGSGAANTGGGGGGSVGSQNNGDPGAPGGSGIVIIAIEQ